MKNVKIIILLLFCNFCSVAQTGLEHEAPTLQVGLDGFNFTKGTLDAQLIMEIVAEKQSEVGIKLVQNMLLSRMDNAGGAFYSYVDNTIRGVLAERDPDVVKKIVLENTVNIAFTYAFSEYYVRHLQLAGSNTQLANLNAVATTARYGVPALTPIVVAGGLRSIRIPAAAPVNDTEERNDANSNFIALITDISSNVIKNNTTLKSLGIMQVSHSQSYEYLNELNTLQREDPATYAAAMLIYNDMELFLNQFTSMIGLIHHYKKEHSYRLNSSQLITAFNMPAPMTAAAVSAALNAEVTTLTGYHSTLNTAMMATLDTITKRKMLVDLESLSETINYLSKASLFLGANPFVATTPASLPYVSINSDIVYTVSEDIINRLYKLSRWNSGFLTSITNLKTAMQGIEDNYMADAGNVLSMPYVQTNMASFIDILSRAYEFDRSATFSTCTKILSDFENIFPDSKIKYVLSFVNTYVRDLVIISKNSKNEEVINLNVESFVDKLTNLKLNKLRRMTFFFSVGVNTLWFDTPLKIESDDPIKNYSFVSEKIGFKFKLKDAEFWRTRNPGETYQIDGHNYRKIAPPVEPIISNWYLMAYGSGILYNIISTGTVKNFNSPLAGVGTGVKFFNSLDLNLSIGVPILKNEPVFKTNWEGKNSEIKATNIFYSLSFDFPFVEYLKKVNEKRKDTKNKKLISEAK